MEIKNLQYYNKLCECKSMGKAAAELYISQQGLSMIVAKLEKELGVSLFFRTSKGLVPTEAGNILYKYSKNILDLYDECTSKLTQINYQDDYIRFACPYAFLYVCPSNIKNILLQEDKSFKVKTSEAISYNCEKWLRSRQCDFAAISSPFETTDLIYFELFSIHADFIVHKCHRLANNHSISLEDLKHEALVTASPNYKLSPVFVAQKYGVKLNIIYEATHPMNIPSIIQDKPYCVGCSCSVYRQSLDKFDLVAIPGDNMFSEKIYLARLKNEHLSIKAKALWDYIINTLPW